MSAPSADASRASLRKPDAALGAAGRPTLSRSRCAVSSAANLREYRDELAFLRKRIARIKDELERAYEQERNLVNIIADAEGLNRMDYDESRYDAGRLA